MTSSPFFNSGTISFGIMSFPLWLLRPVAVLAILFLNSFLAFVLWKEKLSVFVPNLLFATKTSAGRVLLLAVRIGLCTAIFFSGWIVRDWLQFNRTETLANVLILHRWSDHEYRMQTESGQTFETEFCADSTVDWQPGYKIQVMNYEQRSNCKSLKGHNLGFLLYQLDGKPQIFEVQ